MSMLQICHLSMVDSNSFSGLALDDFIRGNPDRQHGLRLW
jgi:acyl carrier protein phosphodiesterase